MIQQMENQRNTHETKTVTGGLKRIHDPLTYSETSGSLPATSLYPATSILPSILATAHVHPYPANLTPLPSNLRPHCAARERLTKWKPANGCVVRDMQGKELPLSDEVANRILQVLGMSFAPGTLSAYGAGLLAFHVFCDKHSIEDCQRTPCSTDLITAWISTMAGTYTGASVKNYVAAVRAWCIVHGVEWEIQQDQLDTILRGAEKLQPATAQRKQREPYTIKYINNILSNLDGNDSLDAAVAACLTTAFFCITRLDELTVTTLKSFKATDHVTPENIREGEDRNGFKYTILHVPRTKMNQLSGEDIYFSSQLGDSNPTERLHNHLLINKPQKSEHLFTYTQISKGSTKTT
jgi:hypothetical protein